MFERLCVIINYLHALRRIISKRELNIKILKTLPRSWQFKVDAIQEGNDLATFSHNELRGKLLTYERTYIRESLDLKKRKNVAFQASHKLEEEDEEDLDFENKSQDDKMALVTKNFLNMYKKRSGFRNRQILRKQLVRGETSN